MIECDKMCREALIIFAGHFFISAFTMADAGVQVAALTGKSKSLYTPRDERDAIDDIKELKKHVPNSWRATPDGHDDFMETLRWIIPNLTEVLQRAVKNKALRKHEWIDLLKWWFKEAEIELAYKGQK